MAKKPTLTTLASGFNSTETLNANFEALRDGFDNTLSLDGSTPNAMGADLDLNGNNIIGAAGLLINGTDYLADVTAAKAAALAAQAAAETAETNAETAETNAEASETAVGLSATAAATSATASAASAVDATNNGAAQVTLAAAQVTLATTAKTAAELAETNAETAESNASTSATSAATSASTASTGASTATTKASEAATSATNAATSATESETAKDAAETARDAALAALDNFDDRYLGAKANAPTVDNDGNALIVGALYFNTGTDKLYIWNGTAWQVTTSGGASGDLISTNNLSDVTSAPTSRTNLGLGTTDSPTFAGLTTTADVSFGDNDKAIFGAGSDLQIHHDGSNSYIQDTGTGDLVIMGDYLSFRDASWNYLIKADVDDAVGLYHSNTRKLATTSTGIDVTGTVTADGLTVDGASTGEVRIRAADNAETTFPLVIENSADSLNLGLGAYGLDNTIGVSQGSDFKMNVGRDLIMKSDDKTYFKMGTGGDVSFYEDTGTTAKFFWDASAESLGIGTTNLLAKLSVQTADLGTTAGGSVPSLNLRSDTGNGDQMLFTTERISTGTDWTTAAHKIQRKVDGTFMGYMQFGSISSDLITFGENATEYMRIDGSGNVGIGTTSPATALDVTGTVTATGVDVTGDLNFKGANPLIRSDDLDGFLSVSGGGANTGANVRLVGGSHATTANDIIFRAGTTTTLRYDHSATRFDFQANDILTTGTVSATTVDLGNWTVTESSGVLHFATGGTNKMKLDATGNLTVVGNVTAYGTI